MRKSVTIAALACMAPAPALASPGLGDEVYEATVEKGEVEVETKFDSLAGGAAGGENIMKLELGYGVSDRLRIAVHGELEHQPGGPRKASEAGIEAIYHFGKAAGIDFALYGEYAVGLGGNPDVAETKLLMQRRSGPWDLRLNLVGAKPLRAGEPVQLSYAASIDRAVARNFRLGVTGFGDLGSFSDFAPRAEHFIGPVAKFRIPLGDRDGDGDEDRGVWIQTGYLFPLSDARAETKGQFRLSLEFEL